MKFTTLVATEELAQHLGDPNWIVFDCRFTLTDPETGRRAYQHGRTHERPKKIVFLLRHQLGGRVVLSTSADARTTPLWISFEITAATRIILSQSLRWSAFRTCRHS